LKLFPEFSNLIGVGKKFPVADGKSSNLHFARAVPMLHVWSAAWFGQAWPAAREEPHIRWSTAARGLLIC